MPHHHDLSRRHIVALGSGFALVALNLMSTGKHLSANQPTEETSTMNDLDQVIQTTESVIDPQGQ